MYFTYPLSLNACISFLYEKKIPKTIEILQSDLKIKNGEWLV